MADDEDVLTCGQAWVAAGDLSCLEGFDGDTADLIVLAASRLLWAASGRRFYGVCEDTVRVDTRCGVTLTPYGDGWFVARRGSWCGGVELPGHPIVEVTEIKVDGVALPDGSWSIVDDRYVLRADGTGWPSVNGMDFTYRFGEVPPPEGVLAAHVLSCELKRSIERDRECRLPKRLTSITREGLSQVILDPFGFFDKNGFGLYETDSFVNSVNPAHIDREAKVLNVDLLSHAPYRIR